MSVETLTSEKHVGKIKVEAQDYTIGSRDKVLLWCQLAQRRI